MFSDILVPPGVLRPVVHLRQTASQPVGYNRRATLDHLTLFFAIRRSIMKTRLLHERGDPAFPQLTADFSKQKREYHRPDVYNNGDVLQPDSYVHRSAHACCRTVSKRTPLESQNRGGRGTTRGGGCASSASSTQHAIVSTRHTTVSTRHAIVSSHNMRYAIVSAPTSCTQHPSPALPVDDVCRGRAVLKVVYAARLRVEATPDHPRDQHLVGNFEQQKRVGLDACCGQGIRLNFAPEHPDTPIHAQSSGYNSRPC